jgi:hypothetical protein
MSQSMTSSSGPDWSSFIATVTSILPRAIAVIFALRGPEQCLSNCSGLDRLELVAFAAGDQDDLQPKGHLLAAVLVRPGTVQIVRFYGGWRAFIIRFRSGVCGGVGHLIPPVLAMRARALKSEFDIGELL